MSRASAAGDRAAKAVASKLSVLAPPWLLWGAVWLVAALAHAYWDTSGPVEVALVGITAWTVTAGLSWFAWKHSHTRGGLGRWHAAGTVAAAGVWLMSAAFAGPERWVLDAWLIGAAVPLSWNIRAAIRHGDQSEGGPRQSALHKVAERTGLDKAQFTPKEVTPARTNGRLQLEPGHTVSELQKSTDEIASALAVPPNGVRVVPDPGNASRADLTIVWEDMLDKVIPYEPPPNPGQLTLADPFDRGVYEDAEPVLVHLYIDGYGMVHYLVNGMPGSGKTAFALGLVADVYYRLEAVVIAADVTKGEQTFKDIRPGLTAAAQGEAQVRALLGRLEEGVVPRRTADLAKLGLDKWQPGCGIPAILLWMEEATKVVADDASFAELTRTLRSIGIVLVTSQQRSSYKSIDTDARANFPAGLCFGVRDLEDAAMVLPDDVIDAGADPTVWRASKPGCSYLAAPRLTLQRQATALRIVKIDGSDPGDQAKLRAAAAWHAAHGDRLDKSTILGFGELWAEISTGLADRPKTLYVPGHTVTAARPTAPVPDEQREQDAVAGPVGIRFPEPAVPPAQIPPEEIRLRDDELARLSPRERAEVSTVADVEFTARDPMPDAPADLTGVPGPVGAQFTDPQECAPDEARATLWEYLRDLRDRGYDHVEMGDLAPLVSELAVNTGRKGIRSRSWFAGQLAEWSRGAEAPLRKLRHPRGRWDITRVPAHPEHERVGV